MAIGWLTLIKGVPWAGVISTAPLVAEGAKQLWKAVSKKPPSPGVTAAQAPPAAHRPPAIEALEARIATLEAGEGELHAQMLKSSELIKVLADQNAQLVRRVEVQRVRLLWLGVIAFLAAFVSLAVVIIR